MASLIFSEFVNNFTKNLLQNATSKLMTQQTRNTYVFKRRFPPQLAKFGKDNVKRMKARHFIYDLVDHISVQKVPKMSVILTQYVDGVGKQGEIVEVKKHFGRHFLLLPKLAVYDTEENRKKYTKDTSLDDSHSTKFAGYTAKHMSHKTIYVTVNRENPWTIQPWHITMALRHAGFMVPDYAVELPEKQINGPDLEKQFKDFAVYVTINNCERFPVRCRISHWSSNPNLNDDIDPEKENLRGDPVLPEQAELLDTIPLPNELKKRTLPTVVPDWQL